ncbi:prepilin peptidase [Rhizorhabdus dicambivorans]|uniref:Prepilin leader peptidase/N-methyltransferase n=1 Tax=Rhizorhabdus dicambivorans TaxID=1850238 RepID=A0A2A4FW21_9SPHN|nr:A24 family peptidase [Rhizorhabdus dicambivorans]ATE65543.1 prepilin peptidase [Rhizorhabdus dicambivorans]PCE41886.1 prepilin peptidase [Rhizorhabdus dicambivorans]
MILLGAVLGAVFGSFLATAAIRWPREASALRGRSACDGCGAPLTASQLIPVLSFFLQRGRAVCCGARIDRLHPAGEIAGALLGAMAVAIGPDIGTVMAGGLFASLLLLLALLDARHYWLPDPLNAALALAGVGVGLLGIGPGLSDRLIGGVAGFLLFAAVRHGYRRLRGREGMGGGDVKLFGAIGLWLGWQMLPLILFGAAAAGLFWALILYAAGRSLNGTSRLPFGVFLALAAWVGWVALFWPPLAALAGR